jgi:hypothetical protein
MQTPIPAATSESDIQTVYFFRPKFGRIIGSFNEYKIKKMIGQEYGNMAIHRDPLHCACIDFLITIQGDLHNDEWID